MELAGQRIELLRPDEDKELTLVGDALMHKSATFHDFADSPPAAAIEQEDVNVNVDNELTESGREEEDDESSERLCLSEGGAPAPVPPNGLVLPPGSGGKQKRTLENFQAWLRKFALKRHKQLSETRMRTSISLSVVHEGSVLSACGGGGSGGPTSHHHHHQQQQRRVYQLGSDGESIDASPCTSDETTTSPGASCSSASNQQAAAVKMRAKTSSSAGGPRSRWSEQDIAKRLSLPAELKLPASVVEKLNRRMAAGGPLSRKSRRASLCDIGFGKLSSYQKLEKLGEGTYATVYKGRSRLTEALVALKEIRLEQEEGAPCTAIREVSLLRDLRHANVVTLHDIIHTERMLTLVFEYVERDLKQYMDDCNKILAINNVRLFLFQLLRGLHYCHSRRVLHRDLKPQNLLITRRGELKLADFGLARAKSVPTKSYSHEVVTLWYRPPDVLLGQIDYSTHIDMWGVGCVLFEMAAGRPFFPGGDAEEQLHLIFRALGTPTLARHPTLARCRDFLAYQFPAYRGEPLVNHAPRLDADGADLLGRLLHYEGPKRIETAASMGHRFFANLPDAVHRLNDEQSIFEVAGLALCRDPGALQHQQQHLGGRLLSKGRRQSLLL